jgi:hypothetical protein
LTIPLAAWALWPARTALDPFWAPVIETHRAPLIFMERYGPRALIYRLNRELGKPTMAPPEAGTITGDIAQTFGQEVMIGNVQALLGLERIFSSRGLHPELRIGADLSTADLAERAVILVGYFNNPWAQNLKNDKLRFTLDTERAGSGYAHVVRDTVKHGSPWRITSERGWFDDSPLSYAIVTRMYDPHSKRFLVALAGMTHLGTQAAGEFICGTSYLEELRRQLVSGWETRNLQVVLETRVVNGTPTPPRIVASHSW